LAVKGNVVMTQGALGHSGAQGRAKGFHQVIDGNWQDQTGLDEQPADWDVTKVRASGTRSSPSIPTSRAPSSTMTTWRWPRTMS
jgi:hypothetical protein